MAEAPQEAPPPTGLSRSTPAGFEKRDVLVGVGLAVDGPVPVGASDHDPDGFLSRILTGGALRAQSGPRIRGCRSA
jgi:hypothetical protein